MKKQKILIIIGPTASGKSALAVEIARQLNGEIISADSRQVYRGLTIGTGKIGKREMKGIAHHLIDVASPGKIFTADDFVKRARDAIDDIAGRGKLPIVVGGTGFYIDALLDRIKLPNVPPNTALREKLQAKTPIQLYALLKKRDPARARAMASKSERNNKVRLIRALEIAFNATANTENRPLYTEVGSLYDMLWVGLNLPQRELEGRIHTRLVARIKSGMIAEGKRLHAGGLSYKRMENLGLEYRSIARLLQKKISRAQFEGELFRDIRRYAKKQIMYWKRNTDIRWFDPKEKRKVETAVRIWLAKSSLPVHRISR